MSRKELNATCLECGKRFHAFTSNLKRGYAKYCSWKCRVSYMQKHGFPASKEKVKRICGTCGIEFLVNPSDIKNPKHSRFCSQKCMIEWRNTIWTGENNPNFRNAAVDRICEYCGKPFRASMFRIRDGRGKFCSKKCHSDSMKLPDIEPKRGENWQRQRRLAKKRDNYTCKICGKKKSKFSDLLDAHHIIKFRLFCYIPGENNHHLKANDLDNLLTLCRSCHRIVENKPPEFFRPYFPEETFQKVMQLQQFVFSLN